MHDSVLCQSLGSFQAVAGDEAASTALQTGRCLEAVVAAKYSSCNFNYIVCIQQVSDAVFG